MPVELATSGPLQLVEAGGPILWVLVLLSVVALTIVAAKALQFTAWRVGRCRDVEGALHLWRSGARPRALSSLENSRELLAPIVHGAMQGVMDHHQSEDRVREEAMRRSLLLLGRLRNGLRPLELIAQLSPLLGLLGTVLGMITAFQQLEAAGSQPDPSVLSGGIWVALLTTAAGLLVAIPALFAHSWLESRVDRCREGLEDVVTRVFTQAAAPAYAVDDEAARAPADAQAAHAY